MDLIMTFMAIVIWGLIIFIASLISSLMAKLKDIGMFFLGMNVQVLHILLSLLAASVTGNLSRMGFIIEMPLSLTGLLVAVVTGFPLTLLTSKLSEDYKPKFIPDNAVERLILSLVFAPLGEEILFRGLLEGMLITSLNLWLAVAIPATLFSIIHMIPFSDSPRRYLCSLLISALLLGLLASYLRDISGSLLPAIAVHFGFNLSGELVYQLKSADNY